MQTHDTDHIPATSEQLAIFTGEIALAVAKAKPSFAHMQQLLGSKAATRRALTAALKSLEIASGPDPRLVYSQQLWAKLGLPLDILGDLTMPEIPDGWAGVAIIPPFSREALFALCVKHFPSWKYYNNLDDIAEEQDRPKRPYVIGHRGGIEPDIEHRNKGYDTSVKEGLIFLTQKERICIELLHFVATGDHLDKVGVTVTSSLAPDGHAFVAYWYLDGRRFHVHGCHRRAAGSAYGPRQAVYA